MYYPQVVLYDALGEGAAIHEALGSGPYLTSARPVTVLLTRGASAYLLVAKYRCDLGVARTATAIKLVLPAGHGPAFSKREAVRVTGAAGLSYCRGGRHDPGQVVAVSPVEPTLQAATSLPGTP